MKFMRILLPILILLIAAGGFFLLKTFRPTPEPKPVEVLPPLVEVMQAEPQTITLAVASQGTAQPRTTTQIVPQIGGRVIELAETFVAGGAFEKGTPLVKIEPLDYELAIAQAEQNAAQAALLLAEEEARAKQAEKDWKDLGRGAPSDLVLRKPQLKQARAAKAAAEAAVKAARRDLERTIIPAPYDGRVMTKNTETGEFVAKGAVLGQIYDGDLMEVGLPLGQSELSLLDFQFSGKGKLNQPLPVELNARFGSETVAWEGAIKRTSAAFDEKTRTLQLIAEVTPQPGVPPLLPGQFVTANIEGRTIPQAYKIPRVALRGLDQVLVVSPEATIGYRQVTTLSLDDQHVVVTEGLNAGDRVCVTPLQTVTEGMKVRVQNDDDSLPPS